VPAPLGATEGSSRDRIDQPGIFCRCALLAHFRIDFGWKAAGHSIAYSRAYKASHGELRLCLVCRRPAIIGTAFTPQIPGLARAGLRLLLIGARVDHDMRVFAGQPQHTTPYRYIPAAAVDHVMGRARDD
jgi:hypothetical protein